MSNANLTYTVDGKIQPGDKLRPGWRNGKRRQWLDALADGVADAVKRGHKLPEAVVKVLQSTGGIDHV